MTLVPVQFGKGAGAAGEKAEGSTGQWSGSEMKSCKSARVLGDEDWHWRNCRISDKRERRRKKENSKGSRVSFLPRRWLGIGPDASPMP